MLQHGYFNTEELARKMAEVKSRAQTPASAK
jgi:hypothetical protein